MWSATACVWFSTFFENAFVSRVNRLMCILSVRFERSENDVLTCLGSGFPSISSLRAPVHSEARWLTAEKNLSALADLSGRWINAVHGRRPPKGVVLDMDSSVSPTHGEQENSVWNGHYECPCYHPLFVFNQFGDLERCALRPGNVHSADGWDVVLKPVVARYRGKISRIYFRADAGFANPEVYEYLEAEGIKYAIRIPANSVLQERIGYLLAGPVGRPSNDVRRSYANFTYQ